MSAYRTKYMYEQKNNVKTQNDDEIFPLYEYGAKEIEIEIYRKCQKGKPSRLFYVYALHI